MQALDNLLLSNDLLSCKNNKSANLRWYGNIHGEQRLPELVSAVE